MSLTWKAEWLAISRRISGVLEAGHFYLRCRTPAADVPPKEVAFELLRNAQEIFRSLEAFLKAYESLLPVQASSALNGFIERAHGYFQGDPHQASAPLFRAQLQLMGLTSLQAELSYKLSDFEANARRLSERAFSHLQRSIVADAEFAKRWRRALREGEPSCERLGASHLLAHGIWAFKAGIAGERTDLIMGDRVDPAEIERSAEALVLTEWKRVKKDKNPEVEARKAYEQARLYSEGSLAGFQLDTDRFLVLVSRGRCTLPPDFVEEGVRYRYVNIAVEPESPSRVVRSSSKRRTTPRSTGRKPRKRGSTG